MLISPLIRIRPKTRIAPLFPFKLPHSFLGGTTETSAIRLGPCIRAKVSVLAATFVAAVEHVDGVVAHCYLLIMSVREGGYA
jgi:hypothetical protein